MQMISVNRVYSRSRDIFVHPHDLPVHAGDIIIKVPGIEWYVACQEADFEAACACLGCTAPPETFRIRYSVVEKDWYVESWSL